MSVAGGTEKWKKKETNSEKIDNIQKKNVDLTNIKVNKIKWSIDNHSKTTEDKICETN